MNKFITVGVSVALSLSIALPALAFVPASTSTDSASTGASVTATQTTPLGGAPSTPKVSNTKKKAILKTLQGKVSVVNTDSLTFASGGKEYTAQLTTSTELMNRTRKPVALVDIRVGDTVRVYGLVNLLTVKAQLVRDITLPVKVKKTTATSTSTLH